MGSRESRDWRSTNSRSRSPLIATWATRSSARPAGARRAINGEQVPAGEKVYSIFEFHTDLIKRGKARRPVQFGHKVFAAESGQGLITDYQVLEGNPADTTHVAPARFPWPD
jgi:hypothetical protein